MAVSSTPLCGLRYYHKKFFNAEYINSHGKTGGYVLWVRKAFDPVSASMCTIKFSFLETVALYIALLRGRLLHRE